MASLQLEGGPPAVEELEPELKPEPEPEQVDQQIADIAGRVRQSFGRPNALNLVALVSETMELCETLPKMSGPKKKAVALLVVDRLIDDLPAGEGRAALAAGLQLLLPSLIDGLVAAAKGQFDFGKVAAATKKCCRGCCIS